MLASMFISGGINSLRNSDHLAARAAPVTERLAPVVNTATQSLPFTLDSKQMVQLNGIVHVLGGAMLATGRVPRLSALALAASLVPTTLAGHRFWEESDPQQRANQQVHFFKNVSMIGGLLLASVDTEGKPSIAWLARRGADRARRQAVKQAGRLTPG
jgi:putative oxidoreductase